MKKKSKNAGYEKQVQLPYRIEYIGGLFFLKKGKEIIWCLKARSENGADREAAIFLKIWEISTPKTPENGAATVQ